MNFFLWMEADATLNGARFSVRVSDLLDTAVPFAALRALPNSLSVAGDRICIAFQLVFRVETF